MALPLWCSLATLVLQRCGSWWVVPAVRAVRAGCSRGNRLWPNDNPADFTRNNLQNRLRCRTNLSGKHTEGLPHHSRDEPVSQAELFPLFQEEGAGNLPEKR
jgi:hypothetical protein